MAPEPQKAQEFDAYRDTYSDDIDQSLAFSGQSQDFFTKVKAEYILDLLEREHKATGETPKVLDVGCGHGLIHPFLLNQEKVPLDLTGIDVAASVVDVAKEQNPSVKYDSYDGITLPYENDSFSFAFAICVMHHVPPEQWVAFLKEMKRVVKPGGIVAIFEHNPLNPLTLMIVNNCPIDEDAVLLRSGTLKNLYGQAKISVKEKKFILFTPFDKPFFRSFDKAISWLPLGAQYYIAGRV